MRKILLRALVIGNLLVYGVIAGLMVYFYLYPPQSSTAASGTEDANRRVFLSLMLPTPTEVATVESAAPLTLVPMDTPLPGPAAPNGDATPTIPLPTAIPPTVVPVNDRSLVPPSTINIILMGTDRRPGQINWRTDVLILASINQQDKTVGLLSIPRDLWVQIPGIGAQRINTADFYGEYYHLPGGGPASIKRTIEQNLGIRVHYYVRVGFDGFRKSIDTLGGIDVDVTCPLTEKGFYDDYGRADLNYQPGVTHMDGVSALRYARSRYTTNDFDRGRRQRMVLLAMWDKALSLNLLPKWPELFSQYSSYVQTDLGPVELAGLAFVGSQLHLANIKSRAIDNRTLVPWVGPNGEWVQVPQPEKLHSLLVEFFSPPTLDTVASGTENAKVEIVSGNQQAENIAASELRRDGLTISDVQLSPTTAAISSLIVHNSKPATVQRLLTLLRIDPASVQTVPDASASADIQVILGRDYSTCQR